MNKKGGLMQGVLDIAMWIILGSLVVLIIMNPSGFSQDVSAIGGGVQGESKILTGSGYVKAK